MKPTDTRHYIQEQPVRFAHFDLLPTDVSVNNERTALASMLSQIEKRLQSAMSAEQSIAPQDIAGLVSACRRRFQQRYGQATVAYIETEEIVCYGIAFCNPSDGFSRFEGRSRAIERLEEALDDDVECGGLCGSFYKSADDERGISQICYDILLEVLDRAEDRPHWAKNVEPVFRNPRFVEAST